MNKLFFLLMIVLLLTTCSDNPTNNNNNNPQILSLIANPDTISTSESSALTCNASDKDGDGLTFVWGTKSGSINGSGNNVAWLSPDILGTYYVTCKVLDGNGGEAFDSVRIAVLSSEKVITSFILAGVSGTIIETTKTITLTLPFGSDVTALIATFSTTGVSVRVAGIEQTSGSSVNNFTNPVIYTVIAADGSSVEYTVTVTVINWEITTFPAELYGNWYSDYDGTWQWGISGSTTIRTFNRFFTLHSTYGLAGNEYEYMAITTEGGLWYTFFFKNVTANHMQATFPGCPSAPSGYNTESEAFEQSSVYNQYCDGFHK
jgi:Bacterial Ig domain